MYEHLENFWSIESNLSGWFTLRLDGAKILMTDTFDACITRIKEVEELSDEDIIAYDDITKGMIYPSSYWRKT